ncbi:hypothetical protein Tco_1458227 [Tanacetum coccineum]
MLLAKKDEAGVILSNEENDFLLADASEIEELEELSANICMIARIQKADSDSEDGPSYDSAFISEVQDPSTSFMNPLYSRGDHEQTYPEQQEIIKPTIGNDQINSDIIFDDPNVEFNDGKVKHDKNAHDRQDNAMELLARNACKEAEKQLLLAKKDAPYLHSSNVRANVCDTKKIIEDATKIELSIEQKYFLEASTSTVTPTNASTSSSSSLKMPKSSKMLKYFQHLEKEINKLHALLDAKTAPIRTTFTNLEDTVLRRFCYDEVKLILDYLHAIYKVIQKEFPTYVQVMMNVFYSMESELDETLKQNEILKDQLLEATLTHDVEKCVLMGSESTNDNLNDEIEKVKRESRDIQENLLKRIKILENVFQRSNTPYYSRPIRRIQDFDELKDHCLTLKNTPYPHQRYAVYNTLVNKEEPTGFTTIRRIHQEDTAYLAFGGNTRDLGSFGEETGKISLSFLCVIYFVIHSRQPPWETRILSVLLEITSHKGYRNTIELPVGNNAVLLQSDTIQLVQNGCSFHELQSEDPNQHLKDFLKLVDSLDLDGENKERIRLRLFQFSLHDQASNWIERLSAGSVTTWEYLTTRFLA